MTKDVVDIQAKLKAELATLKERVDPPSGFSISLKGKKFTLPDGSASPGPMHAVILDWVTSNVWFEGIYNAKDPKPPVCWAIGRNPREITASKNAPKPQGAPEDGRCHGCPKNEWGSDPNGGKGKACKNRRRLLVAPADADAKFQPWTIEVSPTGIKHFDKFINALSDLGMHPMSLVTEISFEENEPYPSLRFKPLEPHGEDEKFWAIREAGQSILFQEPKPDE